MKIKTKNLALFFTFLMLFSCGDSSTQETQPQQAQPQETQPQETQPQETQPQQAQPQETQPQQEEGQGPQGQGPQGQGPQGQGPQGQASSPEETIRQAIGIIEEATQEVLDCISFNFGGEIYTKIVEELDPDEYEAGIVIGCKENPISGNEEDSSPEEETEVGQQASGSGNEGQLEESWYSLSVYEYTPTYTQASSNGSGTFGLNESADIILSGFGFNNSGGKSKLNHPVSVSSNGEKLAVTDRFNNRVLVWNSIPASTTPPDLVLGQENFTTHNSGTGLANMDFPGQVSLTPDGKILVADSDNNRVLVWTSFPTSSGQAADYAIPVTNYVNFGDSWPWGVWSDGTKVIISATVANSILFWDSFPGPTTPPDVVLTSSQVGTPRSIISDGNYIMIGDENANGPCIGQNGTRSTHVWISWPTSSRDPDACIDNWLAGAIHDSKIYGIAAGGETMYFYDELYTTTDELKVQVKKANPNEGHRWAGGDDGGAVVADGKLFVAEYNGNRISVFDSIPSSPTEKPDWSLLTDKTTNYPLLDDFIIQNPIIESNGTMLFVSSDFDRSLSIWKQIPGSSGAQPDIVMRRFDQAPWDMVVFGKEVYLVGGNRVFGWNNIENTINSGNFSFDLNTANIGSVTLDGVRGIAYNGTYFALANSNSNSIYIWEGVPGVSDNPTYTLSNLSNLGRIAMNDTHLAIGCYPGGPGFKVIELSNLSSPIYMNVPGQDCPSEISFNDKGFFIPADDRIIGWDSINDALAGGSPTMSFGGRTDKTNMGTRMAAGIGWDGYHLWVGEYKFSNRLLGFAP